MKISKLTDEQLAERFRDWYIKERSSDTDEFATMYMEDPDGCLPEECVGEDLCRGIVGKVYWPHRFIAQLLLDKFGPVYETGWTDNNTGKKATLPDWIMTITEPSYEGETFVVMYLSNRSVLLYHNSFKMWHYYFPTLAELGKELREIYESCKKVFASLEGK